MTCLDTAQLEALVAGTLAEGERSAAEAHAASCPRCAHELEKTRTSAKRVADPTVELKGQPPSGTVSGPLPVLEKIGPYALLERLGEGGMGAVYTAYDPQLDRKVAIKLLRPEREGAGLEESQARLLREAQAMARLDSPYVVAVHAAGTYLNKVYVVMDRVEGQTLKDWLAGGEHGWREILEVFIQAGKGLAAAHAAGIVHRDFKPSNVLLSKDGRARVTDFGLARAVGQAPEQAPTSSSPEEETAADMGALETPITHAGAVMGTPRYMAPEQSLGQPGDPRSDQFSFCVALYEALFHERPFEKKFNPLAQSKAKEPSKPGGVPAFMRRALLRGLSILPDDRFGSMDELLSVLSRRPKRRLVFGLGAGFAVTAALAVGVTYAVARRSSSSIPGCDANGINLASVWNADVRQKLQSTLTAAGASQSSVEAAVRQLAHYSASWATTQAAACQKASTERADQGALLELSCLGRERNELEALLQVLMQGDKEVASSAAQACDALIPPTRSRSVRPLSIQRRAS